jgi:hypothetical protein
VGAAKRNRRTVEPTLRRRNIVTQGINLIALRHWRFRLAEPAEIPRQAFVGAHGPVRASCIHLGSWLGGGSA